MARRSALTDAALIAYIEDAIPGFHAARLASLGRLKLRDLLRSKNPYLFRAKNILLASELVQSFMNAHLSSQEESIFGGFLERLAIFVSTHFRGGRKSMADKIDLEFDQGGVTYVVAIKSGPNWGNSAQIDKLRDIFRRAARVVRTNSAGRPLIFVNGCCYGREVQEDRGDYLKLCGQSFWELLSGDAEFYRRIILPLGHRAREHNAEFNARAAKVINQFTEQFIAEFCTSDGAIDWDKLLIFNSGRAVSAAGARAPHKPRRVDPRR